MVDRVIGVSFLSSRRFCSLCTSLSYLFPPMDGRKNEEEQRRLLCYSTRPPVSDVYALTMWWSPLQRKGRA